MIEDARIVVEPSEDSPGDWYWAVLVNKEVYADGEAGDEEEARERAERNYKEWLSQQ